MNLVVGRREPSASPLERLAHGEGVEVPCLVSVAAFPRKSGEGLRIGKAFSPQGQKEGNKGGGEEGRSGRRVNRS